MRRIVVLLVLLSSPLHPRTSSALPWGKDEDLTLMKGEEKRDFSASARMGQSLVRFHQEVISPADGPRSHFYPSSSQYTLDAMKKYGLFSGILCGCDRLMRENSEEWVYPKCVSPEGYTMKYDPVR